MAKVKTVKHHSSITRSKLPGFEALAKLSKKSSTLTRSDDISDRVFPTELTPRQAAQEQLDIRNTLKEIINSKDIVPRDLKLDDSSMPKAKNYYEWVTADRFLGSDMPPYLEQALIGIRLFAEYCPRCSNLEWMADGGHTAQEGLSGLEENVQLLEYGVCPKCGARRSHLIKKGELNFYNELALNAGQRSGKSALVAMLSTYVLHLVLKSQKPTQLFRIKSNSLLSGTFVALTYAQAKDTLWEPFYQYIIDAPWFNEYHELMRTYERKYGREFVKIKDTIISYRHRSITFNPSGPDKRSLRGRTRIVAAIDEIAYFDNDKASQKVKYSAAEVYIALERSLRTIRNSENRLIANEYDEAFTGYFFNISSPVSQRDKIMELVRLSQGSKKMLGVHKPTWEMNPDVTREALDDEFRKDPATAMRDYGAEPPMSANPFITSRQMIMDIIRETGANYVKLATSIYRQKDGTKHRYASVKVKPAEGETSVMAIDAGYSNNCFALAVGSLKHVDTDAGSVLSPVIDCVAEINPLPGIPLHYSLIYEGVIVPLIRARNVKILLADRWQSIKILSDAELSEDLEISKQYSLKFSDFIDLKLRMQQQQFRIPKPRVSNFDEILLMSSGEDYPRCFEGKPVEHLILQMLTVQHGASNVIKGEGLTDDLWRATALCVYGLSNPEYSEILQRKQSVTKAIGGKLAISKSGSSGRGNLSGAGKTVGAYKLRSSGGSGGKNSVQGLGVRSKR